MGEHERVMRGQRLELVLGADERKLGHFRDLGGESLGEQGAGVEPRAHRRAALGELIEAVQSELDAFDAVIDLRRIAAEFLP